MTTDTETALAIARTLRQHLPPKVMAAITSELQSREGRTLFLRAIDNIYGLVGGREPTKNYEDLNLKVYAQYLGTIALLGRVVRQLPKESEHWYGAHQAFKHANAVLVQSEIVYEQDSSGGYSAFDRDQSWRKSKLGR